jgi:hypothetical protein
MRILFSPDDGDGNGNQPPILEAPPAAATVITGIKTEAELKAEADKLETRKENSTDADEEKKQQTKISELEDEIHRLKQIPSVHPAKTKRGIMEKFLSGESED